MARPTKYHPKLTQALIQYFSAKPYKKATRSKPTEANDFPTLAGFAHSIGVHRETLLEWAKPESNHPEFSDAYRAAKDYQEHFLIVNGLKGLVSSNFAIFTAKNVLGWRDKQPDEKDNLNINITLADRVAKARARNKKG